MRWLSTNLFDFDAEETHGQRIVFRVLEVFIVAFALKLCWEWGFYIRNMATATFPIGLGRHVDLGFMYKHGASLVNALLVTALCLLGFTRRGPRWVYFAALLLLHIQYVSRYSLGKITHSSVYIGMGLLALALAVLLFEQEKERRRFAQGFIYFFMGLAYSLAALSKLVGTGPDWPLARHLLMWMHERQVDVLSSTGSFEWNPLQELILGYPSLGPVLLAFGLIAEACGVLIWWRKSRYFIIPILIGMHIGIALTMNIFFSEFIYELLILGLPWAAAIDKMLSRYAPRLMKAW